MRRTQGFTLLELLIAIAIFALLALATYRMLDSVLQTDSTTRAHELQLRELVRAMAAFERDLLQVIARPARDPFGEARPALLGEDLGGVAVELSRAGWRNPLGRARAGVQRVRWQLSGEQWQRRYWNVLDQAQDSQAQVQQALHGVTRLQLRYLHGDGGWRDSWPPAEGRGEEALAALPRAVELVLEHRRYGELRRLLRLPDVLPQRQAPPSQDGAAEEAPDVQKEASQ
ncbi:type II secretion system minor pseudopilin GspJ [Pseudomonas lalucatii]|uniref:Type II secretion system protein J n=1 Tax=Pseudomonas lalucatii TaxID=1424203 RepID=A0ABS5Q395_9PSED|nr:type II secretion system minor pseudopilin GspJ [Pseudomonas lalucatii]MBS7662983.1 type II secretion system minor pseudopilin GspJ [Pseudomonas lalucatii]MBS7724762.1 type II secretion system minor pseudopilin GspJ [Pseudomonas lalucatii]